MEQKDKKLIYAKKLKSLRLNIFASQKDMAEKFNTTQQCYAKMESGNSQLTFNRIEQICNIFKISYNDFIVIESNGKKKNTTSIDGYNTKILKLHYDKLLRQKDDRINELELKLLKYSRGKSKKNDKNKQG